MSLQELEPSGESSLGGKQQTGNRLSKVDWFRSNFPNFWTPKIVEARSAAGKTKPPHKKKPQTWWSVARNVHGTISHVSLNINLKDKTYRLVCTTSMREWPILEATLLQATSHGTEWVTILLGDTSSIRLNRAELLVAYNHLKSLT